MSARTGRRAWLANVGSAAAIGLSARAGLARARVAPSLLPDPAAILELPAGFHYTVLQRAGSPMDDGFRVPGRPDAMACFSLPEGRLALMRNHELAPGASSTAWPPGSAPPALSYRPDGAGGVTRVVVDGATGARLSSNLVLSGTTLNCAGGISPWGFLTCEETTEPGHGYVFLCDPNARELQKPNRITAYGRFRHEAAVVHPTTYIAYLTEDQLDSAFYRFVPSSRARPFEGRLQALCVEGKPRADTAAARAGTRLRVTWCDVPDPTPDDDSVRAQARARGAARFVRGEGMWCMGDHVYFTATAGGPIGRGQVFRLNTRTDELVVLLASEDPRDLDMPDNLTVSNDGVVYLAEDGPDGNLLRVLLPDGRLFPLARNVRSAGEFAGVCFAPDGKRMFVNLQDDGLTLTITGPFDRLALQAPDERTPTGSSPGPGLGLPPGMLGLGTGALLVGWAALASRQRRGRS